MTTPPDGIDPEPLEKIRLAGGDMMVEKIIALFLEHAPQRLAIAREAVSTGDASALEQSTHSLKSSAAQLGAQRLSDLCRELEQGAARKDLTGAGDLVASAEDALRTFNAWISRPQ